MPHLEITQVVLVHCSITTNDCQYGSRIFYPFVTMEWFDQLLDISPKKFMFLKTFNSEFSYNEVWFTNQNCKALEIEGKINITHFSY